MILDTSAVAAIVLEEPGFEQVLAAIGRDARIGIGSPTLVEVFIVLARRLGGNPKAEVSRLMRSIEIEVIPFSKEHCDVALEAFLRYRKSRHPAALNFGDCMAYATAKVASEPLLFVGRDFAKTDIKSVSR